MAFKFTRFVAATVFGLVLVPFFSCAQFNDTVNYYIRLNCAGVMNKTNDRTAYVLNNNLRFSFYRKDVSVNTHAGWIYGQQQGVMSNNDYNASVDADLFKSRHSIYYWSLLHYEKSFSLKLDHRFQGGAGIGYYVLDRKNFMVHVSDGILYETTGLTGQEGAPGTSYDTYRNSFRIKYHILFHERISLDGTNFVQHAIGNSTDYIVRSNNVLGVKLWKWISLSVTVTYNKLNLTGRENFLLNYGLVVERYF